MHEKKRTAWVRFRCITPRIVNKFSVFPEYFQNAQDFRQQLLLAREHPG